VSDLWAPPSDLWVPTDDELSLLSDDELEEVLALLEAEANEWSPQAKQALAERLSGVTDELLYGGAAGGGKTEWGLEHVIAEMERHPGNRGIVFRRVFPSLRRSVVPRARMKLHGRARWNGVDHEFTFPNGSVLELGHLQYRDSVADYQGAEYGVIFFEEVTEFLESQYEFMLTRLRAPVDGVRAHAVATTNPGGHGHRWVKRRWIRPKEVDLAEGTASPRPLEVWRPRATPERPKPGTRCFVPATLADNPALTRRDPDYVQRLRGITDRGLRRAMEVGDWDAIDAVEGALWEQSWLDGGRVLRLPGPDVLRRVVAVDPSDGEEEGDAYGVAVCSRGMDGVGYVESSHAWRASPRKMAEKTVALSRNTGADAIVVERNHGGKWLREVFRQVDRYANVVEVWASKGKVTRAEPVAALFEPDPDAELLYRARLVGEHPELEEELTTFTGGPGEASPNRLDAVVWGLTDLLIGQREARTRDAADERLRGRR
jgi:phage terminase large subunit-like protein